jgi:hypothetical protein
MGSKLLWLGLTLIMSAKLIALPLELVGAILMIIGVIMLFLDK